MLKKILAELLGRDKISAPIILCSDLDHLLKERGEAKFNIANCDIVLSLDNPHERRYAACLSAKLKYPQYDIDTLLMKRFVRFGDVVLDAGANIGLTALHFLEYGASRVFAVEALPWLAQRIREIGSDKIITIEAALSDKENGFVEMAVSKAHNQGSTYDRAVMERFSHIFGNEVQFVRAPTATIDALGDVYFDIWKLDVEGAEIDVTKGAISTLQKKPPRLIIAELWDDRLSQFREAVSGTHPYVYRAGIFRSSYELHLSQLAEFEANQENYYSISPTYVFSRKPI